MSNDGKNKAFTLTELMIVVVIVGIIAAFAVPNYTKAIRKSHERDMILQLTALHASNLIYRARQGTYWIGATGSFTAINTALGINIISNDGTTYSYNSANGTTFTATATWDNFTVQVTESAIDATNPSCLVAGRCPSL